MRLTYAQRAVLDCIKNAIDKQGYAPTVREIAEQLGYGSSATVHHHLCRLRAKGAIDWIDGSPRTIRVLQEAM